METHRASLHHQIGFTLIELLVVMTIMITALSIVIPYGFNTVEKAQRQQEVIKLKNLLASTSHFSFLNGEAHHVIIDNDTLIVESASNNTKIVNFKHLTFFEPQILLIDRNGMLNMSVIALKSTTDEPKLLDVSYLNDLSYNLKDKQ